MDRLDRLEAIEQAIWTELARAPSDRGHGWRLGVLATIEGTRADARSVLLREADAARHELVFYTDSRSPKVRQFETHPQGSFVLWCPRLGWQLRLRVTLAVQTSGLAVSSRWARLKMSPAAQDYLSPLPPGSTLEEPVTPERDTRAHFGMVTATVTALDWLELHAEGHRRAAFDEQGSRWLVP